MATDDRRGGIGFGNQRKVDAGARQPIEDDEAESTRAMDVSDFDDSPAPTEFVQSPVPPPQRMGLRPGARPGGPAPASRQPPPPPPRQEPEEEEAATRMLDAMDMDDLPAAPQRHAAPQRQFDLKVVSGPDRGKVHKLVDGDYLVGRGLDCQIVLADPAVSRKHFQVRRKGDQAILEDLGGPNGTKVNGEKKASQVLEPGDQVEVGMTVLEFQVDGQGKRGGGRHAPAIEERSQRQPAAESRGVAQARPAGKSGGPGKMIAIAAGLVALLVVGGIAAWLVLGKKPAAESAPAAAEGEGGEGLVADAKKAIADKDFKGAIALLKKAKEADKDNPDIGALMRKASAEAEHQTALEDGKKALTDGNLDEAITKLGEIDDKSAFYTDAQTSLKIAKDKLVGDKLKEAKAAQAAGDTAKAQAAVKAVLDHDADNVEAKALQTALGGAAPAPAPAAAPDAGAAPAPAADPKAAEGDPKAAAAAADPKAAAADPKAADPAAAAAGKKADFAGALASYQAKQWSAAVQTLDAIANGPFSKDEKKKAAGYVAAIKKVEAAWSEFAGAGSNATKAIDALKKIKDADENVNGFHKSFCVQQLMKNYLVAAQAARANGLCKEAVENAEEVINYSASGSDPAAKAVIDGCKADGKKLLDQAEQALKDGKTQNAKELAAKAEKILGSDPLAQKAKDILKKASAAGRDE